MIRCSTVSTAIDPELVARFKAALERLNPEGGKIGLAVSGGPDSMAMLLLAHEAIPGEFEVATVDHGLRPEARDECALVEAACAERGVPCAVLTVEVGEGNVQAMAREARYAALESWAARRGFRSLATAHHADDQAETLLMRLNRGSGLPGLAGIREQRVFSPARAGAGIFATIRPLLAWRRSVLADIVADAGIDVVHDPSNSDDKFDRARLRKALIAADWLSVEGLAQSSQNLCDALEAISFVAEDEWDKGVQEGDGWYRYFPGSHPMIETEVLVRLFCALGQEPNRSDLRRLHSRLRSGENASLAGVLATSNFVEVEDDQGRIEDVQCWTLKPEPPRRTG